MKRRLEEIKADEIEEFVRTRFTHVSADEFCEWTDRSRELYQPRHLVNSYGPNPLRDIQVKNAQKGLVCEAISQGYEFITNADYAQNELIATGWERKVYL